MAAATVLVVDDDTEVLGTAAAILKRHGFDVLMASSATEALTIIGSRQPLDLLFTDILMPGMDGFALAHEARQIRPALKIAYTSGFVKEVPWGRSGIGYGPLIPKPWNPQAIGSEIEKALG